MLRKGAIRVNKKRVKPEYHLEANDIIKLPNLKNVGTKPPTKISDKIIEFLEQQIIYEDENLMILNKPTGFAAHGGSGINFGIIEIMRAARPKLKSLELAHRLDRETSGCLILAKKRSTLRALHQLQRENKIEKKYLLLVRGKWHGGSRKIETLLAKNKLRSGERMVEINETGKKSITTFKPVKIFANTSILEAKLGTGRTHQIRVQVTHIEHPIAGDEKYGDKKFNADMRALGLKRLFLHAEEIKFHLPDADKTIKVKAPLPAELATLVKHLI